MAHEMYQTLNYKQLFSQIIVKSSRNWKGVLREREEPRDEIVTDECQPVSPPTNTQNSERSKRVNLKPGTNPDERTNIVYCPTGQFVRLATARKPRESQPLENYSAMKTP